MTFDITQLSPGRRLRVLRVAAGLEQWQLAALVGIAPARVSELENERPTGSPEQRKRLAALLEDALSAGTRQRAGIPDGSPAEARR